MNGHELPQAATEKSPEEKDLEFFDALRKTAKGNLVSAGASFELSRQMIDSGGSLSREEVRGKHARYDSFASELEGLRMKMREKTPEEAARLFLGNFPEYISGELAHGKLDHAEGWLAAIKLSRMGVLMRPEEEREFNPEQLERIDDEMKKLESEILDAKKEIASESPESLSTRFLSDVETWVANKEGDKYQNHRMGRWFRGNHA